MNSFHSESLLTATLRDLSAIEVPAASTGTRVALALMGIVTMIRKLKSGKYRLYSRKKDAKTGKRKNLGTFYTREKAEKHERAVQYFKHH